MVRKWMDRFRPPAVSMSPPRPATPFIAIGDVHGRVDLLEQLLDRIDPDIPILCVGDYVDRGEHSAEVLRLLMARSDITCLMGNHEDMLLSFLRDPVRYGPHWLRNGGLQTLASFKVFGLTETAPEHALEFAGQQLADAMGADLIKWITELPTQWQSGNVAVVHAGADPAVPMNAQTRRTLIWGHADFATDLRQDGIWVVHGHTIVDHAQMGAGRISIDTGAYATGRLSAVGLSGEDVEFAST